MIICGASREYRRRKHPCRREPQTRLFDLHLAGRRFIVARKRIAPDGDLEKHISSSFPRLIRSRTHSKGHRVGHFDQGAVKFAIHLRVELEIVDLYFRYVRDADAVLSLIHFHITGQEPERSPSGSGGGYAILLTLRQKRRVRGVARVDMGPVTTSTH
jgi:hypothetical protein